MAGFCGRNVTSRLGWRGANTFKNINLRSSVEATEHYWRNSSALIFLIEKELFVTSFLWTFKQSSMLHFYGIQWFCDHNFYQTLKCFLTLPNKLHKNHAKASKQIPPKGIHTPFVDSHVKKFCNQGKFDKGGISQKQAHWWRKLFSLNLVSSKFTENISSRLKNQKRDQRVEGLLVVVVCVCEIFHKFSLSGVSLSNIFTFRQLSDDLRRYQMLVHKLPWKSEILE